MSRHASRHSGVSCDACGKSGFTGKRYKCLTCYDFDLCQDCHDAGETGQGRHSTDHPMQVILTRVEAELFYGGETHTVEQPHSYTCPLCGDVGLSENDLREHVTRTHSDSSATLQEVICPVCSAHPTGQPNHLTDDFPGHLMLDHSRVAREPDLDQTSMHSRVRRMMVRRRGGGGGGGMDRQYQFYRESQQQSQDPNHGDPLADLLSQLGAGTSRRLPSDLPPHIQQLLDQQELQPYDRSSPSRRPVYRKLLISGGGSAAARRNTQLLFAPSSGEVIDLGRNVKETTKIDTTNLLTGQSSKSNSAYLLNSYEGAQLTDKEKEQLDKLRVEKSLFVQDLLLSTLAHSDTSSDSDEQT